MVGWFKKKKEKDVFTLHDEALRMWPSVKGNGERKRLIDEILDVELRIWKIQNKEDFELGILDEIDIDEARARSLNFILNPFFYPDNRSLRKKLLILQRDLGKLEVKNTRPKQPSRIISSETKREVWRRDEGKCVRCGSRKNLEYDHIIPVSKGGSNTVRNIELLCEECNRSKSDKIE